METSQRKKFLFYPNHKIKDMVWDTIISIILLLTCFITPINLAFADELEKIEWYMTINNTIDILFFVDILVIFNSAYQNEMYEMIDDRKVIAKNYISGWFFIDIMSVLPFTLILDWFTTQEMLLADEEGNGADVNGFARIARISKLYKLVKITRLFRLFKFMQNKNKIVKKLNSALKIGIAFERLTFFLLMLLLLSHFVGCFWIFIARTF